MAHVFISYSHENRDFAELVIAEIKKAEIASWRDSEQLRAGKDWQQQIDDSIRQSFVVLVIMTSDAKKSEYVTYEWSFALGASIPVIPIMRENVDIHSRLKNVQSFDFTGKYRPFNDLIIELNRIKGEAKSTQNSKGKTISDAPIYDVMSVIDDLSSDNLELRIGAAKILGKLKEKSAVPMLLQQLSSRWDVAVASINALGEVGDKSVVPKLIAKFYSLPKDISFDQKFEFFDYYYLDSDADIILALLETLGKLRDILACDVIEELYWRRDYSYSLFNIAAKALIKIDPKEAKNFFDIYLYETRDEKAKVRAILSAMSQCGVDEVKVYAIQFRTKFPEFSEDQDLDDIPF